MTHIKPKFINAGGTHGEFTIEDFVLFQEGGALKHVGDFWQAVVAQTVILDRAHARSLQGLREFSAQADDPELGAGAAQRAEILGLGDQYLIRANIFSLLLAFFEFGLREVYKLHFGQYPADDKSKLFHDIILPLKNDGIVSEAPSIYKIEVADHRDRVRNAFAHGRWWELKESTERLDFYEAFTAVVIYFSQIDDNLRAQGYKP